MFSHRLIAHYYYLSGAISILTVPLSVRQAGMLVCLQLVEFRWLHEHHLGNKTLQLFRNAHVIH